MQMSRHILSLAMVILVVTGCGRGPSETESASRRGETAVGRKGTIALSVLTMTNPFFKVIAESMQETANEHGYDVIVTSADDDATKQHNQVKDFIQQGVSAIVLCPADSRAVGSSIRLANEAGIPVFTADIACLAEDVEVVSHIATDNYQGGELACEAVIEALGDDGGEVAILHYKEVESCIQRVKGFQDRLADHNEGREEGRVEIVTILPGQGAREQGYSAAQDALQAHPDLEAIFAINDPSALGAVAALKSAGKQEVVVVGFDGQPQGKQAIREGEIYGDPVQFPEKIGTQAVEAIVQYFRGEQPPEEILIPTELYRGGNDQ